MGVRRFEDLVCWQLAQELSREVFAATASGPAATDFRFRDQIRDSAASAARNIAEGFGRFSPADFARFLRYAKGSLAETRHHLLTAAIAATSPLPSPRGSPVSPQPQSGQPRT